MENAENIIICVTETTSKKGKMPLFPHVLIDHLQEEDIPYTITSLTDFGGDYVIVDQKIVIERKTLSDFINTWIYGNKKGKPRLEKQLMLPLTSYADYKVILLIEDFYKCQLDFHNRCIWTPIYEYYKGKTKNGGFYRTNMNPKSLLGKLRSLQHKITRAEDDPDDPFDRLEIVKMSDGEACLDWFLGLLDGKKKTKTKSVKVHRKGRKTESLREQRLFFLEGLPNIGPTTSQKLLDAYGTPIKAITDIDRWTTNPDLSRMRKDMVTDGKKVLGFEDDK